MKNTEGARGGFAIVFTGGYLLYTLLFMLLIYKSSDLPYGDFYQPFFWEFQNIAGSYGIGLIGIGIVQYFNHRSIEKRVNWDDIIGDTFAFKHLIYMGAMGVFCLLLALLFGNVSLMYYVSYYQTTAIIAIVALFELYWIEKRPIYNSGK